MLEYSVVGVAFFAVYFIIVSIFSLAMYLLQALGIYKMAKNMGFNNPWLAFVPFANTFMFGKVAETYVKPDGRPSAKFSKILLILQIVASVVVVAFIVFLFVFLMLEATGTYFLSQDIEAIAVSALVLPIVLGYFALLGVMIAFNVVYYIALWRIFAIYNYNNATLFLVLSIFFSFLYPIFLFILRNKQPMFTAEQRVNQQ